ncbi:MAG: bifunctional phosphoglucose/phosphomannose isomerase [Chloroflexi bacterium]|nr:bifunctional phosphoglucose/phosphomannose isomerase [Chloroflexota bacterium]
MFLDNINDYAVIDKDNMFQHVDDQPEHYEAAWELGRALPLPDDLSDVRQVVIAGMGGSAIGGDLLASYVATTCPVPIVVLRGYDLPAYAQGNDTLVIVSSFSGNTEETLAVYEQATERDCRVIAITTGGKLANFAKHHGHTLWQFEPDIGQPRAAIGWSLGLLLALAHRLRWTDKSIEDDFIDAIDNLKKYRERYRIEVDAEDNPAKRQAGQCMGRIPVFVGGGVFEVVARRWKTQFNENSKFWAMYDPMPEMNHNTVVGIENPKELMSKIAVVFITSREYDHPRVALRHSLTFKLMLQNGFNVDKFRPRGRSLLAQMLHAIFYGDYVSFYAAIGTEKDPTVIEPIIELKKSLSAT